MRLVFWQNCLSPHQLPYIVKLLDDERVDSVVVAVGEAVSGDRAKMGWTLGDYPGLERCEVHVAPYPNTIEHLLDERKDDSVHLFSGIRGFAFVYDAFLRSLKYNGLRRSIITERPNTYAFGRANGKPLWMHWLRWKLQDGKYLPFVESIFAMGEAATQFFRSVNKQWAVFPFGYCTQARICADGSAMTGYPRISFVGSLSWRKSVDILLISTMLAIKGGVKSIDLELIGDGSERAKLEEYCKEHNLDCVKFLGTQKQNDVPKLLSSRDVLVLPSIYDGWGAVVNEGLQQGLYMICSDKCGAKDLLLDPRCGVVFHGGDTKDLAEKLKYVNDNIDTIRADKQWRKEWAERCISGEAIAKYMVDCLLNVEKSEPWK